MEDSIVITSCDGLRQALASSALIEPTKTVFHCMICMGICSSNVTIATCCKQIVGCSSCVEQWTNPRCPHCRSPEYATLQMAVLKNIH